MKTSSKRTKQLVAWFPYMAVIALVNPRMNYAYWHYIALGLIPIL